MLALSRTWTRESLDTMLCAGSSLKQNRILERYNNGLTKATPDCSDEQRELWIRCKYRYLFAMPASRDNLTLNGTSGLNDAPSRPVSIKYVEEIYDSHKKLLPIRFVDYFVTIGPAVLELKQRDSALPPKPPKPTDVPMLPPLPASCETLMLNPTLLGCFPPQKTYSDTQPEHCAPFTFPAGVRLSAEDRPPAISTFVLTDANRVKIFGATLVFYELLEPEEVAILVTPKYLQSVSAKLDGPEMRYDYQKALAQRRLELATKPGWHMVYAPRAIALIGHYAFYTAFTEFLTDIYRVSLSASPVPIERFVNNFVVETPLPPMGKIAVCITLPSKSLSVSRPAMNKLPMVDFSYRPLFACLSVDNIITVFRAICGEFSLCFISKTRALLTPVQEAILSFLFPLVWQGAYIPVLPKHMVEILDAPVPVIVGLDCDYFESTSHEARPAEVLFINIDTDEVFLGTTKLSTYPFPELTAELDESGFHESRNRIISFLQEPLPKMFIKLKAKIAEFGGCIYRTPAALALLESAGAAFQREEHLSPLSVFAMDTGTASGSSRAHKGRHSGQAATIAKSYNTKDNDGTQDQLPLLSPCNNCDVRKRWDARDKFDAAELRAAFLRFFVALFIETDSNQKELENALNETRNSSFSSNPISLRSSIVGRLSTVRTGSARIEPFYIQMLSTQMYSEFNDERRYNAEMPEIKYFEESVADKKNRSLLNKFSAASTPFLNSCADEVSETYFPPPPNVSGLQIGQKFEYNRWPQLRMENVGPVRPVRTLLKGAEKLRKVNQLAIPNGYSTLETSFSWRENKSGDDEMDAANKLESVLNDGMERYNRVCAGIILFQSLVRMRAACKKFRKSQASALVIQRVFRGSEGKKKAQSERVLFAVKEQLHSIVRIQGMLRAFVARRRYRRFHQAILRLQAIARAGNTKKEYLLTKKRLRLATARARGFLTRIRDARQRREMFSAYQHQLVLLWKLELTTLHYRSLFWIMIREPTYLNLALLRDELCRLYDSVGVLDVLRGQLPSSLSAAFPVRMGIERAFTRKPALRAQSTWDALVSRACENRTVQVVDATTSCKLVDFIDKSKVWQAIDNARGISSGSDALAHILGEKFKTLRKRAVEIDRAEREALYKTMKESIAVPDLNKYYSAFGLDINAKKKKDTVVYHLLFDDDTTLNRKTDSIRIIDTSAMLVVHARYGKGETAIPANTGAKRFSPVRIPDVYSPTGWTEGNMDQWFQHKRGERVRSACLETLRVYVNMVATQKRSNKCPI